MPETTAAGSEITVETVQHLAGLARISLTENEVNALTRDLDSILMNIAQVSQVATSDVPATSHPISLQNITRPDVVADVLTRDEALQNASEVAEGMFRVSSILGEEQ